MKKIIILLIVHCALCIVNYTHSQEYTIKSKKAIKLYQEAKSAQYPYDKINLLNQALKKEPNFIEAYWELSKIYTLIDSTKAAINTLLTADQLQIAMPEETKIRLSKLYFKEGEYQLALDKINEINNPYYFNQINLLKEETGEDIIDTISKAEPIGPKDLVDLCLEAGSIMLVQAKIFNNKNDAYNALKEVLENGKAFEKLKEFIAYQGGDTSYLDNLDKFDKAKYVYEIVAKKEGFIHNIKALDLGVAAMKLGAGRATKEDTIDYAAGLVLNKKVGDKVNNGDLLITVYTNKENVNDILKEIEYSFEISIDYINKTNIIKGYIE